ncbi:membrane fusion protein, multidrug efflux system [Pseudoxanthomonas sp. GM95]|uniref:HlyD family secretion protein n=1 Tax=Pseudoxanthomonas sp. GM95 TaxID=1881043 RepID=UPI0008C19105|nr:HlyD family secretion protein [Pseudoxanthomonas sp. GM95]SEL11948.1 membrane fusion protein, multidrug efflux system [Pseudoxanthomonas sp. GM95]
MPLVIKMSPVNRFRLICGTAALAAIVLGIILLNHNESRADRQSTDDAYVRADMTVVVPQVTGLITQLSVQENQAVNAGDLLLRIDDRDSKILLDTAQAKLASADATVASLHGALERQNSEIAQARATLDISGASLRLAQTNKARFENLASDGSGTLLAAQQADAESRVQRASQAKASASLRSAEQQTKILLAELAKAEAAWDTANAEVAAARLTLSRTQILAPTAGVVAQRRARFGGYARVGEPLLTLVPLDALYVEASFRETQLARVQIGQPVEIVIDALPGVLLKGRVESLGPASGVSFSPIAPHNATGNFTKIVQRLPVRIALSSAQKDIERLRVGMSVRPEIAID